MNLVQEDRNSIKQYINVDNLKEEIKKLSATEYGDNTFGDDVANCALDYVLEEIIPSLQQEQFINKNTLTWKDINDLERIINNVHYEFRAGIGEKSFGEEVLERFKEERDEQPEVDLEEEIIKYFQGYWPGMKTPEACNHHLVFTPPAIMKMAKHFY